MQMQMYGFPFRGSYVSFTHGCFRCHFYSLRYDIPSLPERYIFKCHHLFPNVLLYLGERGRLLCLGQSRTEQTSQPQSLCGDNSREATTTTVSFPVLHRFSRHSVTDKKKKKKKKKKKRKKKS